FRSIFFRESAASFAFWEGPALESLSRSSEACSESEEYRDFLFLFGLVDSLEILRHLRRPPLIEFPMN
ncbi:hypothetical protein OV760_29470, partial [Salmonella enterica subsp. enterica serovar 1,4,[5],12:i:-]|nr:hypothetical protein [Salmonella enterica subsp. enterica serovar 1,4,[5],12:i:-]